MTQLSDVRKTAVTKGANSCDMKSLAIKGESCSVAIETKQNFEKYCDSNVEKLESYFEDAIENWQNKAKKDDPILS